MDRDAILYGMVDYEDQFYYFEDEDKNKKPKITQETIWKLKKEKFRKFNKFLEDNKDKYSERHYKSIKYCIVNRLNCAKQLLNPDLKIDEVIRIYKKYVRHNSMQNFRRKLMLEVIKERKYTENELKEIRKYKINFGNYRVWSFFDIQWVYRAIFDYVTGRKENYDIPCKKNTSILKVENVLIEKDDNVFTVHYKKIGG